MAVTLDKYGNLRDSVSGKVVGMTRNSGESDESYVARGNNRMGEVANSWANDYVSGKSDFNQDRANQLKEYATTQAPVTPQFDPLAEMQKLKQAQIDAKTAALGKAKNNALSNLSAEKQTIAPAYQSKRNQTSTASQLQAKNFAEYLARRGSANSGVANQAEIARNVSLQGNIGALNQDEANAFSDIARRSTDVSNAYESDVAAAKAGAEAEYMQNYISEMQRQQALQAEQDRLNQQSGAEQQWKEIAQSNWQKEFEQSKSLSDWERDFKERGFSADQARQAAELELARQKAYSSGGSSGGTATERKQMAYGDFLTKVNEWVQQGYTPQQMKNILYDNAGDFSLTGKSLEELLGTINSMYNNYRFNSGGHYVE